MAPDPHPHASLTIETVLHVCFRLLVALTLAAIVAGAFSLLALAAENPTGINPTLQAIDDPQDPTAQYILGHRYAYGRGKPRDYAKALKWFRLAADQGQPEAQAWLGIMYAQGRGVPQNLPKALKWYRLAADQGFILAQARLAATYQHGYGTPPKLRQGSCLVQPRCHPRQAGRRRRTEKQSGNPNDRRPNRPGPGPGRGAAPAHQGRQDRQNPVNPTPTPPQSVPGRPRTLFGVLEYLKPPKTARTARAAHRGRQISARRIPKTNPSSIFGRIPPKKCASEALQGRFDQADDLQPPRIRDAPIQ